MSMDLQIVVPASGPTTASVAIVGEAPGAEEVIKRKPFVGASGHLQDRMILKAGLNPAALYKTNTIKRRPLDIKDVVKIGQKGAVDETEEFIEWRKALYAELDATEANVIVPVGNVALYALTGHTSIMKYRGSILSWHGRKVIPTIHPSALLRGMGKARVGVGEMGSPAIMQHIVQQDWRRIRQESEDRELPRYDDTWSLRPAFREALRYLDAARDLGRCGLDIEVQNQELSCVGIALTLNQAMCIPLNYDGSHMYTPEEELEILQKLAGLLQDDQVVKVGQNLTFDVSFLFRKYGIRTENLEDTMIAWAVCFPDLPKKLAMITSLLTRREYYKDDGKTWDNLATPESFWIYNCKDAAVCLEVWPKLVRILETQGNLEAYRRQRSVIQPWVYATERGMRIRTDWKNRAAQWVEADVLRMAEEFQRLAPGVNPASPKQLGTLFYQTLGYKPYTNRKTGAATTDKTALQRLIVKGCREAELLVAIRARAKMLSTYYKGPIDEDGRLRSSVNPAGAATGRPSSSQTIFGTGMNQFNMPPDFKKLVFADPGYALYVLDLSQAENRIVAYIANEPAMMRAFEAGQDVHKLTASRIYGVPADQVTPAQRKVGKTSNHSLNYGLGPAQFAIRNGITPAEAKFIVEGYHKAYPNIRKVFHKYIEDCLQRNRTIVNCYGRKRLFLGEINSDMRLAANAQIPQSSVTDHMNLYGIGELWRDQDMFGPVEFLSSVYDSLVIQIPLKCNWSRHAQILSELVRRLETSFKWQGRLFVIPVDVSMGVTIAAKTSVDMRHSVQAVAGYLENAWLKVDKEGWE